MPMKRFKPERIVTLLRRLEVEIANGKTTPQACKDAGMTQQTYYRRKHQDVGFEVDQVRQLK